MTWIVEYTHEANNDLIELDNSQRIQVLKAIKKISENLLPNSEGGYGKPLGNQAVTNLSGYLKIKLLKLGVRVVYRLVEEKGIMKIVIISVREDEKVYTMLQERINKAKSKATKKDK